LLGVTPVLSRVLVASVHHALASTSAVSATGAIVFMQPLL
jgi:hypothetical protein